MTLKSVSDLALMKGRLENSVRPQPTPTRIPDFIVSDRKLPVLALIASSGSASGAESGATSACCSPNVFSSARSSRTISDNSLSMLIFTSLRERASASMRTMVTRPTPSTSAISFCVICSTKYIQAARILRRSVRLSLTTCSVAPVPARPSSLSLCRRLAKSNPPPRRWTSPPSPILPAGLISPIDLPIDRNNVE